MLDFGSVGGSHEKAKRIGREDIPPWMRVDEQGRIWTTRKGFGHPCPERSAERTNQGGYLYVFIKGLGLVHSHRVAYAWWYGECPAGLLVRHLNDVKTDNRRENLALGTTLDNAADGVRNGVHHHKGVDNPRAKLTEADVVAIRAASAAGEKHYKIAEQYGVTDVSVAYIVSRKTWAHVP